MILGFNLLRKVINALLNGKIYRFGWLWQVVDGEFNSKKFGNIWLLNFRVIDTWPLQNYFTSYDPHRGINICWHSICHRIYSDMLLSEILFDSLPCILLDILSDIWFVILFGIPIWHKFWYSMWHFLCYIFNSGIHSGNLADILSSILCGIPIWHSI